MKPVFSALGADTDSARVAIKNAGCTHATINANWGALQPNGAGTALDATAMANVAAAFDHARSIGLKVILSINYHYPPNWVLSNLEPFRDQFGVDYVQSNVGGGKAVRNWMTTGKGRTWLADFTTKVVSALGSTRISKVSGCRIGAGWYGELHYPEAYGSTVGSYAWQGFSPSMQAGTDLAAGLSVCPLPGYVPYSGSDEQDCVWLNWYLNTLVQFIRWNVELYKSLGLRRNLWLMLPGYGVRLNVSRSNNGYKQAAALGEDHIRAIGEFMHDPAVWPYSTWMNTADGFAGGVVDSDKSAWKSLYEKSLARGKHHRLIGENTGNESNSVMDVIFADSMGRASYAGSLSPLPSKSYYKGIVWLQYSTLIGGSQATMAHYAEKIAAAKL